MVESKAKLTLAMKLANIGKEIGTVQKSGRNTEQNYNFIEYGVVAGRIRELFDEYGVIIVPSVDDYSVDEVKSKTGKTGYHYKLNMSFTIINGEDKEDKIETTWLGEGLDYGDKGINKAETSGTKYFLMRLFNVSEKGEQDPDSVSPDIESSATVRVAEAPKSYKLDFKQVREHLGEISTVAELNEYWSSLNLTDKQAAILKGDFTKRKVDIGIGA